MQDSTKQDLRESVMAGDFEAVKRMLEEGKIDINANLNFSRLSGASGIFSSMPSIPGMGLLSRAKDNFLETGQATYGENKDSASYRAIHWAARNGYLNILKYLCEQGAEVNIRNFIGNTALHVALYYNQKEAVKILLEYNANVEVKNTGSLLGGINENFAPLHYAALYGDAESIVLLLNAGAAANVKGLYDLTPLHFAVSVGDLEKVKCLVSAGQDINCVDSDGKTLLHHAILASLKNPNAVEVVLFLLEHQANPNLLDHNNNFPMDTLIKSAIDLELDITPAQLQVAQYLLAWGSEVEQFNRCVYETQSINFSLDFNHFLIRQCSEQKTQIVSLEKALGDSQNADALAKLTLTGHNTNTITSTTTVISNVPATLNKAAPPPPPLPPLNNVPRKKYRDSTEKEGTPVKKVSTTTPADDFIASLKAAMDARRAGIAPAPKHDSVSSSEFSSEEEIPKVSLFNNRK